MNGIDLIAAERQRQLKKEGWAPEHEAQHTDESMAAAAACYAMPKEARESYQSWSTTYGFFPRWWPKRWHLSWWKPTPNDRVKELTKAGALIAAEIDRILASKKNDQ